MGLRRPMSLWRDTESHLSFSFVACLFFPLFSFSFHILSWVFLVFTFYEGFLGSWMLSMYCIWSLQSVFYSLPADPCINKLQTILSRKKSIVLFRIGQIRLFEHTLSAVQRIKHCWDSHLDSAWHSLSSPVGSQLLYIRIIQLHFQKNMRLKVSGQISMIFNTLKMVALSGNPLPSWSRGLLFEQIFWKEILF